MHPFRASVVENPGFAPKVVLNDTALLVIIVLNGLVGVWAVSRLAFLLPYSPRWRGLQRLCGMEPIFIPWNREQWIHVWRALVEQHVVMLLAAVWRACVAIRSTGDPQLNTHAMLLLLYWLHCFKWGSLLFFGPNHDPFRKQEKWFCPACVALLCFLIPFLYFLSITRPPLGDINSLYFEAATELACTMAGYTECLVCLFLGIWLGRVQKDLQESADRLTSLEDMMALAVSEKDRVSVWLTKLYGTSIYIQKVGAFSSVAVGGLLLQAPLWAVSAQPAAMHSPSFKIIFRISLSCIDSAALLTLLFSLRRDYSKLRIEMQEAQFGRSLSTSLLSGLHNGHNGSIEIQGPRSSSSSHSFHPGHSHFPVLPRQHHDSYDNYEGEIPPYLDDRHYDPPIPLTDHISPTTSIQQTTSL
eukprot:gb/GEZN01007251.1/.p1 GENE.gb/GEZN01007251.1/~~gb/GEZN01007251.1/.p1  ORF type:complete len:414 (+),score=49.91 gb/GEZN01007251.1/:175-1416(+)